MKRIIALTCLFVLWAHGALAQASLDLNPTETQVQAGSRFEIGLDATFASSVIGGEIRVDYDPGVLHLEGFDWDPGYGDDPLLRCRPEGSLVGARGCEASSGFLSMGTLAGLPSGRVGRLRFVAVGPGTSGIDLEPASPFANPMGGTVPVNLGSGEVTVVPEPGLASALTIGALALALGGRRGARRGTR